MPSHSRQPSPLHIQKLSCAHAYFFAWKTDGSELADSAANQQSFLPDFPVPLSDLNYQKPLVTLSGLGVNVGVDTKPF